VSGQTEPPGAGELRALFEHRGAPTFGVEEEVMLLDPETLDLAPCAQRVLAQLPGELGAKLELPASQLELAGPPVRSLGELADGLAHARRELSGSLDDRVVPACAGVHPFAAAEGALNRGGRYERIA